MNRQDFINDIPNLSGSAVKVFDVLDFHRSKNEDKTDWVTVSYEALRLMTGLGSTNSVKKAIEEIAINGWMLDYEKGGYDMVHGKRINRSSRYRISEEKLSEKHSKKIFEKINGKYERKKKGKDKSENISGQ